MKKNQNQNMALAYFIFQKSLSFFLAFLLFFYPTFNSISSLSSNIIRQIYADDVTNIFGDSAPWWVSQTSIGGWQWGGWSANQNNTICEYNWYYPTLTLAREEAIRECAPEELNAYQTDIDSHLIEGENCFELVYAWCMSPPPPEPEPVIQVQQETQQEEDPAPSGWDINYEDWWEPECPEWWLLEAYWTTTPWDCDAYFSPVIGQSVAATSLALQNMEAGVVDVTSTALAPGAGYNPEGQLVTPIINYDGSLPDTQIPGLSLAPEPLMPAPIIGFDPAPVAAPIIGFNNITAPTKAEINALPSAEQIVATTTEIVPDILDTPPLSIPVAVDPWANYPLQMDTSLSNTTTQSPGVTNTTLTPDNQTESNSVYEALTSGAEHYETQLTAGQNAGETIVNDTTSTADPTTTSAPNQLAQQAQTELTQQNTQASQDLNAGAENPLAETTETLNDLSWPPQENSNAWQVQTTNAWQQDTNPDDTTSSTNIDNWIGASDSTDTLIDITETETFNNISDWFEDTFGGSSDNQTNNTSESNNTNENNASDQADSRIGEGTRNSEDLSQSDDESGTNYLESNDKHGRALLAWASQWISHAMACANQPWCNTVKTWLTTAVAGVAWSYLWEAVSNITISSPTWGGGAEVWASSIDYWSTSQWWWEWWWGSSDSASPMWSAIWSAAFAWIVAYAWCSSHDTSDLTEEEQQNAESNCKSGAAWSAWTSIATTYLVSEYWNTAWTAIADYTWIDGSSIGLDSSAVWWTVVGWLIAWFATLLQWWSPKQAGMAVAKAIVTQIVTKVIVNYLVSQWALMAASMALWAATFWIWLVVWLIISALMDCPYYYVVLPWWWVAFQWAFLVWTISEKSKRDSYEAISPRTITSSLQWKSKWEVRIKITEETNEDLFLDSASIMKISHNKYEEVIIGNDGQVAVIEHPRALNIVRDEYWEVEINNWKSTINWKSEIENWLKIENWKLIIDSGPMAINLPKIEKETELIFLWWINSNKLFQTATTERKREIWETPDWVKDPLYFLLDKVWFLSSFIEDKIDDFEWITLESCNINDIWECDWEKEQVIITYPQQKRVFTLWKNLIWKNLRLRYNSDVVEMTNMWYDDRIEENEKQINIKEIKAKNTPLSLENTDSKYMVFSQWDDYTLIFDISSNAWNTINTYFLKTNWYYHPKGI